MISSKKNLSEGLETLGLYAVRHATASPSSKGHNLDLVALGYANTSMAGAVVANGSGTPEAGLVSGDVVYEREADPVYSTIMAIQTVLIPVIVCTGFVGNIMAAGAFLSSQLRGASCCLYLAMKSLMDVGFLFSLLVIWLNRLGFRLFSTPGVCQVTVFLTYVCSFQSVWFVVAITTENFIRVSRPGSTELLCSRRVATVVVAALCLITALLYNFALWTNGVVRDADSSQGQCKGLKEFEWVAMAMTYLDTFTTLISPTVVLVVLNVAILIYVIQGRKRRVRLARATPTQRPVHTLPEASASKLLCAVSIIFLSLHLPSHVIRIKVMVQEYMLGAQPSRADVILHRVFEVLYDLNFAINCLIYLSFGDNFRKVFISIYGNRRLFRKLPCCMEARLEKPTAV